MCVLSGNLWKRFDANKQISLSLSLSIKMNLQLDELTDIGFYSQLLTFVQYVKDEELVEEFLFCKPLTITTKEIDIFNIVKDFFLNHGMTPDMYGSLCINGAPAMLGNNAWLVLLPV